MANRNKFEEMLERLINEDRSGAEELFHEIVVEKSRDIYEGLLESDLEDDEVDEPTDEEDDDEVDEAKDEDDDEEMSEDFNLDEFEVEADPMDMMGGDAADDMMGAMEPSDDDGMDMGDDEDEDVEDRVEDLEDALADLKAEFEKMMAGDDEGEEDDDMDMDMDMDDEGNDDDEAEEESFEFEAADDEEGEKSQTETMREYVEKVSAKMGDNGANTKSTVASANNMGGTASNIAAGGEADTKGTTGGLAAPTTKEDNAGNVNVPGAKGATKTAPQPGHGAEKKGKPETADNKKSTLGK